MSWLISISIGPVQDFIATARRSQDLYAGSQILSYLAMTAADFVAGHVGYDNLIFPGATNRQELEAMGMMGVANIILAIDPSQEEGGPAWLEGIEKELRQSMRKEAEAKFRPYGAFIRLKEAMDQVEDFPEIHWAAVPLPDKGAYADARQRVASLLQARKNTRFFGQPSWAGTHPKSSLDGQREAVLDPGNLPDRV
ncbi:MAG: type III-B CRISPR-associated protein Cas10/Cmr2, partial [Bacillota bacterium]|nr:type III-B CRISPR-associated protein Cas10/Cmr2 [Bacillota bacterium]